MKSFDVFDTLIARRYLSSDPLLKDIQNTIGVPNFFEKRKEADTGYRSFSQIYEHLVLTNILTPDQAKRASALEIKLEIETSFQVKENMDKVNHGDLLISDMYLSGYIIKEMVRHAGLTKQVTIYQSNGDKSSGKIWRLLQDSNIELHLGDNMHSDVNVATDYGINAQYYSGTGFSSTENYLAQNNLPHLALLAREVRLRNKDASSSEFFTTAVSFNLPWLFVVAEMIHRKYKDKHIVFLGRDCQLLQQLYSCYYDDVSTYLPFSRKIAYNKPEISLEYITAHTPPDCVLFDIISTGGTWEHMNKYGVLNVCVALYSNLEHYTKSKPILPPTFDYLTKNSDVGHAGFLLEVHNCADHGHLSDISKLAEGTFVCNFDEPELKSNIIDDIHCPIQKANLLSTSYKSPIRNNLSSLTDPELFNLFKQLVLAICGQTQLNNQLAEFYAQELSYLNTVKNI